MLLKIKFNTLLSFEMKYWDIAKSPIGRLIHHQRKTY